MPSFSSSHCFSSCPVTVKHHRAAVKRAFFRLVDESEADAAAKEAELRSSEAAAAHEGHEMGPAEEAAAGEGEAVEASFTIAQPQQPDDDVTAAVQDGVAGAESYPWAGQKKCVEHETGSGVSGIEMAPAAVVVPAAPLMLAPLGDSSEGPKLPLSRLREVRTRGGWLGDWQGPRIFL